MVRSVVSVRGGISLRVQSCFVWPPLLVERLIGNLQSRFPAKCFRLVVVLLLAIPGLSQSGNVVANTVEINGPSTTPNTPGGYIFWNQNGVGETDWVNNQGMGSQGGFIFYNASASGSPLTQLLTIDNGGNVAIGQGTSIMDGSSPQFTRMITFPADTSGNGSIGSGYSRASRIIGGTFGQFSWEYGSEVRLNAIANPNAYYSNIFGGGNLEFFTKVGGATGGSPYTTETVFNDGTTTIDSFTPVPAELRMIIDNYGKVGIGTAVPQNFLSVLGGVNVDFEDDNNGNPFYNGNSSIHGLSFGYASGEGIASARVVGAPNYDGLDFFTSFQKRLSITTGGFVGIGTTSPAAALEVNGTAQIDGNLNLTTGGITFPNGSTMTSAPTNLSSSNGKIGIGTTNPLAALDVGPLEGVQTQAINSGAAGLIRNNAPADLSPFTEARLILYGGAGVDTGNWGYFGYGADGSMREVFAKTGAGAPLLWGTSTAMDGTGTFTPNMVLTPTGSLGIGTTSPGGDLSALSTPPAAGTPILDVAGDIELSLGSGGQIIFPDKTVQATAWNGTTLGGDYAESVDVTGDRTHYEPGDVIVINSAVPGSFDKATSSYSRMVAGVYSTKPGLVGRRTTADRPNKDAEVPMAMMGIVPTKVSTENGAIEPGDLLVSSSTPGYAMKGTDRDRLTGAIIGKALAPLKSGTGVIEVLLALQ